MQKMPDKEVLIDFLGKVSLFQKADKAILLKLAQKTHFELFPRDLSVIKKGDTGNAMYIIFSGKLKVHDGEHTVAELNKGQFFGEISLFDNEPRSMSVTTLENSELGTIKRSDFFEVLREFPEIIEDIIVVLNSRIRNQNKVLINELKTREEQLTQLVKIRTAELAKKNEELEIALNDLKRSQQQLVQSEKLASLGQLTAGIAHEIQNPLNFVNNFSQLSFELIPEAKDAKSDDERSEILDDLERNLEKINQHGKRADSIVKNMLEHSRTGSGSKQVTNLNNLCTEYFNLSYHGMLANNQGFSCNLVKNINITLPSVNIIAQDMSRVLINIFNNAFYAVKQKKLSLAESNGSSGYLPEVLLTTTSQDDFFKITIKDNGNGIPDKIREKIFQPFFTTKPTGEGTGLGLSLSHDIIKAHGGSITVNTSENEFTEFILLIPLNN